MSVETYQISFRSMQRDLKYLQSSVTWWMLRQSDWTWILINLLETWLAFCYGEATCLVSAASQLARHSVQTPHGTHCCQSCSGNGTHSQPPPAEDNQHKLIYLTYIHIHILNTAVTNGFDKKLVDKKITTFRRLKHIKETTTLSTLDKDVSYKSLLTIHGHIIHLRKSSNTTT